MFRVIKRENKCYEITMNQKMNVMKNPFRVRVRVWVR